MWESERGWTPVIFEPRDFKYGSGNETFTPGSMNLVLEITRSPANENIFWSDWYPSRRPCMHALISLTWKLRSNQLGFLRQQRLAFWVAGFRTIYSVNALINNLRSRQLKSSTVNWGCSLALICSLCVVWDQHFIHMSVSKHLKRILTGLLGGLQAIFNRHLLAGSF